MVDRTKDAESRLPRGYRTSNMCGTQLLATLQSAGAFDVELALFDCFFRRLPVLARRDVGSVPAGPVVLRSRGFVLAMMLLCLAQKLCQRRHIQIAESSSGQPRGDFLEQPGVAVGVIKRGKRKVAAVIGCQPADATAAVGSELGPGS